MVMLHTPRRRFYTPYEVAMHSSPDDCWVSFLGGVFDITALLAQNEGALSEPLIQAAGEDISHWFDATTGDVKRHVDPLTNLPAAYAPMGRFIHVPPNEPTNDWSTIIGKPWWQDQTYRPESPRKEGRVEGLTGLRGMHTELHAIISPVGSLSGKLRCVRIKNVLTSQEETLEVPEEETIVEIRERYLLHNWHAKSYTWKAIRMRNGKWKFDDLDMNLTLDENGVLDEVPEFQSLDVPTDYYIPVLHVYWNDDLTVA